MDHIKTTSPTDLYWLADLPDWDSRLAAVKVNTDRGAAWSELVALANARTDPSRTNRLARVQQSFFGVDAPPNLSTKPIRLAVLSSSTVSHLLPGLKVGALRKGLWLTTYEGDYGQYFQDLSGQTTALSRFKPTHILISLDARHMTQGLDPLADAGTVDALLAEKLSHLEECWRLCQERFGAMVMQQAILPIFDPLLGGNEHRLPGSKARFVRRLNEAVRQSSAGVDVLAVDDRSARDGIDAWHSPSFWYKAKQEVAHEAAPLYGDLAARLLAGRQGRSSKVLVLDLDNTLWGGVIGDDGLGGIVVGEGNAWGESFLALQRYARELAKRGVVLAVCSKNDEQNARLPFTDHPDMILKNQDISCFVANWDDKATNIRRIAKELNLGLDSLVFVDDNPFERGIVRSELPMVAVPEVPDEPAAVARCLADAGYFESPGVTADDRERTAQYASNAARASLAAKATDIEGYLRGLEMRLLVRPFDQAGLARITQLINKTNQFNLTTRRYSELEVGSIMEATDAFGLQFRLLDKFGDNGMIAVVIGRCSDRDVILDTWLMSCRVLGRGVENAILGVVAEEAKRRGATRLVGIFKPTAKNGMVEDLYGRLDFTLDRTEEDGGTSWSYDLAAQSYPTSFIDIEVSGHELGSKRAA